MMLLYHRLTAGSYAKDYDVAASYFRQLASFYSDKDWLAAGVKMLDIWAQCLKCLGRPIEYIPIALKIIASQCSVSFISESTSWYLIDLISTSSFLKEQIAVPMGNFFRETDLDSYISHYDNHDGFRITLYLQSRLPVSFKAQSIEVRFLSVNDEARSEVWLSSEKAQEIGPGVNHVTVGTKV